jgi:hypothetical protein
MTSTTTRPRAAGPQTVVHRERTYAPTGSMGKQILAAAALAAQIKQLTTELDKLRPGLTEALIKANLDVAICDDVVIRRKTRHNWTYSPATEREQLALRNTQKYEQAEGLATDTPKVYCEITTAARG